MQEIEAMPPRSLKALRDLTAEVQRGQSELKLGKKALQVLAALLDDPAQVAVSSISELAHSLGVNPSTLTRLSKKLGFTGFNPFQDLFRQHLTSDSQAFSEKASRWIDSHVADYPSLEILQQITRDELNNLELMVSNLDPMVMDRAADQIARARSVMIHGSRQFNSMATFNAYCLGLIRENVELLGNSGHGFAHGLAQKGQGDLLLLIGAAPYTRITVEISEIARRHDIYVIALTDSHASPLAHYAHSVLVAPTTGAFFANNSAATLILSEALLGLVAGKLGARAVNRLKQQEILVEELGIALTK